MSEREELQASLRARHELGAEYEPQLVDSFLEKVEKRLEQRMGHAAARRERPRQHHMVTPIVLGSLGLAIPLIGVAGSTAGAAGVAFVCLAIVLVNVVAMLRR